MKKSWVQVPSRILAWFQSRSYGFEFQVGFWVGWSPGAVGSSSKLGIGWVWILAHGLKFQSAVNGFTLPPWQEELTHWKRPWCWERLSGGDGIPVELFQILKDDAMKVLYSICQQIWKIQQWPQDWKMSVFIPIPRKGNAKECSNYYTIALISHASKVMLKIFEARLQQYMNCELSNVQAGFRKGRGTRDQIANIRWIMEKAREFQKNIYFCFIDYAKAFDCVDHNKLENSERDGNTRPPDLPLEKPICRSGSNS